MTPKPWAVVLIQNNHVDYNLARRTPNATGVVYIQDSEKCVYSGTLGEDTPVFWCDDEETANTVVRHAQESYPKNSYAICKTQAVSYVPPTAAIRAVFTPAGLLPA